MSLFIFLSISNVAIRFRFQFAQRDTVTMLDIYTHWLRVGNVTTIEIIHHVPEYHTNYQ